MLMIGDWCIDQSNAKATHQQDDNTIDLDPAMVKVLTCLAENQHRLVSARELINHCGQIEDLTAIIDKLCEVFNAPVIECYNDNQYLLNIPTFRYNYQPVTLDDVKEEALKQLERQMPVRRQREIQPQEQQAAIEPSNPWLKLAILAVGFAVILFVATQS